MLNSYITKIKVSVEAIRHTHKGPLQKIMLNPYIIEIKIRIEAIRNVAYSITSFFCTVLCLVKYHSFLSTSKNLIAKKIL